MLNCIIQMKKSLDEEFHLIIGQNAVEIDPNLVYVSIINNKNSARVIVYCGKDSSTIINAGSLAKTSFHNFRWFWRRLKKFWSRWWKVNRKIKRIKTNYTKDHREKIG